MLTLRESIEITGKSVFEWLDLEMEVPRVDKAAAQGDVLVVAANVEPATEEMPACYTVVESEASTNTHTLHPNGTCYVRTGPAGGLVVCVLTVPEGSTALLSHPEHGNLEILAGTYEVRRQREFRETSWAMVHD